MDDEVVVHPAWWDADDPSIRGGRNPMLAPSAGIWSYDVANFGAFAQFTRAQDHQIFAQATSAQLGGGCGVVLDGNHGLPYVLRLGTPPIHRMMSYLFGANQAGWALRLRIHVAFA